ncbi:MAG: shikimate dehydrogenase, partial [Candidatus Omnitrophota bacterium]|nr:shikimate dehydrogenase [Candidatus Omnitrophota bacterium]
KIAGINVTIPHKIKAKAYLDDNGTLDENAKRLGAVNTIKISEDGSLYGFNTDGPGFYRSLLEDLRFEPEGKNIFVLGAGGAARAVIMYLGSGPKKIRVFDIDKEKTRDLKNHYDKYYDGKKLFIAGQDDFLETLKNSDLLINATPVGMKESDPSPVDKGLFRQGLRIYDLVYNRPVTQLVKEANSMKLHAVTGIGMLLYQGAIAFEIWTGKKAPVAVMKKALKAALKAEKG